MKPLLLRLKNFIGIRDGLGMEEVAIDLSSLRGLIALAGPNGAGKTTFLDNLHPYRLMPCKTGGNYTPGAFSFYNETFGASEKELIFEMAGLRYRSVLHIDQERNKQEAYLYVEDQESGGVWKPVNRDGKVSTYDKTIEALVGSPKLYFNSIFRCQDAPRLNTYRKGVIKDILAELLLLSDIQARGKTAKAVADLIDELVKKEKAKALVFEPQAARVGEIEKLLAQANEEMKAVNLELSGATAREEALRKELQDVQVEVAGAESVKKSYQEKKGLEQTVLGRMETTCRRLGEHSDRHYEKYCAFGQKTARLRKIMDNSDVIRTKVEEEAALTAGQEELLRRLDAVLNELAQARKDKDEADKLRSRVSGLEVQQARKVSEHKAKITALENEVGRIKESVKHLYRLPCSEETLKACPVYKATAEEREKLPGLLAKLEEARALTGEDVTLSREIAELNNEISALFAKSETSGLVKEQAEITTALSSVKTQLDDAKRYTRLLSELQTAEQSLAAAEAEWKENQADHLGAVEVSLGEVDSLESELRRLRETMASLEAQIRQADRLGERSDRLNKDLETVREQVGRVRDRQLEVNGRIAGLEQAAETARNAGRQLAEVNGRIGMLGSERELWSIVQKAFSNDGIIALEIDDAGPHITGLANRLLESCYGPRFAVKIVTQDMKDDGTSTESFDISVTDNESGTVSSLHDKSGGEKTWVEDAVTKAIALFHAERSGKRYDVLMTDERDGALSYDAKRNFFRLKKEVLDLGGFASEFFISHTPDAQDVADCRLVFARSQGIEVVARS
jgi:exonuclease SbcC